MYYPYFRGKQFELILLRDNAKFLADNKIHPIIEPVKENLSPLKRAIEKMKEHNVSFTLIINPYVGDLRNKETDIIAFANDNLRGYVPASLGYIMTEQNDEKVLRQTVTSNSSYSFSIIHYGYEKGKILAPLTDSLDQVVKHIFIDGHSGKLYQSHFKKSTVEKILIRNGFRNQKNAEYPTSEHFSDLHVTYPEENMNGFGDFLIIGDDYSESGGPAYAVAIHLTYLGDENVMLIYHFKSDRMDSPTDPAGKFLEALTKLVRELDRSGSLLFKSNACKEFKELHNKGYFPGLGYVKKLSMQHHLELMANFLSKE